MSKSKSGSFTSIVVKSLGWPLFWGMAATFGFYLLIESQVIQSELVSRYFAGHPVEYVETALFFIGVMALLIKATDLAYQFRTMSEVQLTAASAFGETPTKARELLDSVMKLPASIRETYLSRRLANALRYVSQSSSADDLDEQLRYLSDVDSERSHNGYALVRMIVWATPMLGFLGTVIGITLALGQLSPEALVNAPKDAMQGLLAGLSVAFDTTALALSLSIVLMFLQYLVREVETQLLTVVDRRAEDELIGRFQTEGTTTDPNVNTIRQMSEKVLDSIEKLTEGQADLWSTALSATQREWSDALQSTNEVVQGNFKEALDSSLDGFSETMAEADHRASQRVAQQWQEIQDKLKEQADILSSQHETLHQQGHVMERALEATMEVQKLEAALNQNLSALAGAKNFEDTVMSLSVAIQLLTSRLGIETDGVDLQSETPARDRAA